MLTIEIGTFAHQLLPQMLTCEGEWAREIEEELLRPMVNFEKFQDDTLIADYIGVSERKKFIPFGLPVKRQETGGLGHHFIPYLHDLEEDFSLLKPSEFSVDEEAAQRRMEIYTDLFGDILPVKRVSGCLYSCPTQDIVHIMNMDDMFMAMIDDEDRFVQMLDQLTDDYLAWFELAAQKGQLVSGAEMQWLAQGSYCFTDELPEGKVNATLKDMWLFMDSQETSGISPAMFRDLVFPSYKKMMDRCGLVSYGCCEPVHALWDDCLSKVENLRKVSISPWCDEQFMGERLAGSRVTYLRKPPATILGLDEPLNEDAARETFRNTAIAARGCKLEIAQRDVYLVNHDPDKVRRYVEIGREELENWSPAR